jgi:DNA-binding LacI/PurR family transcriptional regulator
MDFEYETKRTASVPPEVRRALDRMCTPLDESRLSGATAQEDARCMAIIKEYIESGVTSAVQARADLTLRAAIEKALEGRHIEDGTIAAFDDVVDAIEREVRLSAVREARNEALEEAAQFLEMQTGYTEAEAKTVALSTTLIRHLKRREPGFFRAKAEAPAASKEGETE